MKELKKQMELGQYHRCYLLYGEEGYLKKRYIEMLKQALLEKEAELMNLTVLEGKPVSVNAILDTAQTAPFLTNRRLILVKNSGLFQTGQKEASEQMAEGLVHLPETACVLFSEEGADKRGKLFKAVQKYGFVAEFKTPSEKELIAWVIKMCKKQKLAISSSAAMYLLRTTGEDMENLEKEMAKLAAYLQGKKEITPADIDAVCTKSLEIRIFDLVDALGRQQAETALSIYRNLLLQKESPLMVLSMMMRQFRMIYQCKLLSEMGEQNTAIGQRTGLRDFMIRECLRQGQNFSVPRLKQALEDCLEVDIEIKTGRIAAELGVEVLLLEYAGKE